MSASLRQQLAACDDIPTLRAIAAILQSAENSSAPNSPALGASQASLPPLSPAGLTRVRAQHRNSCSGPSRRKSAPLRDDSGQRVSHSASTSALNSRAGPGLHGEGEQGQSRQNSGSGVRIPHSASTSALNSRAGPGFHAAGVQGPSVSRQAPSGRARMEAARSMDAALNSSSRPGFHADAMQAPSASRQEASGRAMIPQAMETAGSTMEFEECAICFDPLPNAPTVVLTKGGRRVCRHFFHKHCAACLTRSRPRGGLTCPYCRAAFDACLDVPDVEADPRGWFRVVDFDGNQALDQREVLEVMKATVSIDYRRLEQELPDMFADFDSNGDGSVVYEEMMGPHGLFDYLRRIFRATGQKRHDNPDLASNKEAWFKYWDEDGSGSLDRGEVLRSLVHTFKMSGSVEEVQMLRSILDALWHEFDPDHSGTIELSEFCQPGVGLADVLIANLGRR